MTDPNKIIEQLEDLKRLTIMMLLASGVQSGHIAKALGIDRSAISRMMPVREIQKFASRRSSDGDAADRRR